MKKPIALDGSFTDEEIKRLSLDFQIVKDKSYEYMFVKGQSLFRIASDYSECASCSATLVIVTENLRVALLESAFPSSIVIRDDWVIPENIEKRKEPFFSQREEKLLSELEYGLSTKELCQKMALSERSLRRMKEKLLEKTGLFSTQQLALYSLLHDLVRIQRS